MTVGANDSDGIVAGTVIGGQAQTQEERLTVVVRTRGPTAAANKVVAEPIVPV